MDIGLVRRAALIALAAPAFCGCVTETVRGPLDLEPKVETTIEIEPARPRPVESPDEDGSGGLE